MPTNKTIREEFDEKFVNKHTGYVIGGAEEIKFFIEKALLTQLSEIEDMVEGLIAENFHFWRECHNCGLAKGGYLHCVHDDFQSPCHGCGKRMPSIEGECNCEFVITENELESDLLSALKEKKDKLNNI